jgi:hypothetical protein
VLEEGKNEGLAGLCKQAKATEYISGPAAKDYLVPDVFVKQNLSVTWFDYTGFKKHPQLWGNSSTPKPLTCSTTDTGRLALALLN